MEEFLTHADRAIQGYRRASHIATMTYPSIKDPKILLSAMKQLHEAFDQAMLVFLSHDYHFKRLDYVPEAFRDKLDMFRRLSCQRFNIPREVVQVIQDVAMIIKDHKSSEMEFRRKQQFIIASRDYRLRTITIEKLKNYLISSKPLLSKVLEVKRLNDKRIR